MNTAFLSGAIWLCHLLRSLRLDDELNLSRFFFFFLVEEIDVERFCVHANPGDLD